MVKRKIRYKVNRGYDKMRNRNDEIAERNGMVELNGNKTGNGDKINAEQYIILRHSFCCK